MWLALDEVRATLGGDPRGKVRIFAPGGETYADIDVYFPHAWGDVSSPTMLKSGGSSGWQRA